MQKRKHSFVGRMLNNLGNLYLHQEEYEQAYQTLQRSLQVYTQSFGAKHLETAIMLTTLGYLYIRQCQYMQAKSVLERAFNIYEKVIGLQCPEALFIFQELVMRTRQSSGRGRLATGTIIFCQSIFQFLDMSSRLSQLLFQGEQFCYQRFEQSALFSKRLSFFIFCHTCTVACFLSFGKPSYLIRENVASS